MQVLEIWTAFWRNILSGPDHPRNIMDHSLEKCKKSLDIYMQSGPDQTGCGGYVNQLAAASNSLTDPRSNWSQT